MRRGLIGILLVLAAPLAAAQDFPSKPVRLTVPWPAGGIVDIIGRAAVEKVSANWGNPIVVEAKPGANGSIDTGFVAKSAPDGYTWLLATLNHTVTPSLFVNVPWHPSTDFAGVAGMQPAVAASHH